MINQNYQKVGSIFKIRSVVKGQFAATCVQKPFLAMSNALDIAFGGIITQHNVYINKNNAKAPV